MKSVYYTLLLSAIITIFCPTMGNTSGSTSKIKDQSRSEEFVMTLTTQCAKGEVITIAVDVADEMDVHTCWIDLNNNGKRDQGESITTLSQEASYIVDAQTITLYGPIEFLGSWSGDNQFTSIDLTHNVHLKWLDVVNTKITSIDVRNNTRLERLDLSYNPISTLDLSQNSDLEVLRLWGTNITSLDISQNTNLEALDLTDSQIVEPGNINKIISGLSARRDLPKGIVFFEHSVELASEQKMALLAKNWWTDGISAMADTPSHTHTSSEITFTTTLPQGEEIELMVNVLSEGDLQNVWIDLNANGVRDDDEEITTFGDKGYYRVDAATITVHGPIIFFASTNAQNQITSIDTRKNPYLKYLDVQDAPITSIDVSKNLKLQRLNLHGTEISSLDVSNNQKLESLNLIGTSLSTIDITKNERLDALDLSLTNISSIDISKNKYIRSLHLGQTQVGRLDTGNNPFLRSLNLSHTPIASLRIEKNLSLKNLDVRGTNISALDVWNNIHLERLDLHGTPITSLDLSKNIFLNFLNVEHTSQLSLEEKNKIITSLPDRKGRSLGTFRVDARMGVDDKQLGALQDKNWYAEIVPVRDWD